MHARLTAGAPYGAAHLAYRLVDPGGHLADRESRSGRRGGHATGWSSRHGLGWMDVTSFPLPRTLGLPEINSTAHALNRHAAIVSSDRRLVSAQQHLPK
jgi:hypothetical protein